MTNPDKEIIANLEVMTWYPSLKIDDLVRYAEISGLNKKLQQQIQEIWPEIKPGEYSIKTNKRDQSENEI